MSLLAALWTVLSALVLLLLAYMRVAKRPAHRQQRDEVVIRRPGQRMFGAPEPLTATGPEDLPFALISQAAYQRKGDPKQPKTGASLDPDKVLEQYGWAKWPEFEKPELYAKMRKVHLRVEVWWHLQDRKIAVAFGGTVFTNWRDWAANLRWFLPHHDDQYTLIVGGFGRAFEEEYAEKLKKAGWQHDNVHLFSTGHSLGGGLAQEFAYSLPLNNAVPRITKVYAFDPSPVTGFYSTKKNLRDNNVRDLDIDRIFERGEILAFLRSIVSLFVPPRRKAPTIRQIRYDLFPTRNPIRGHSIIEFTWWLYKQLKSVPSGKALVSRAIAAR
jgi:hypothetical protein